MERKSIIINYEKPKITFNKRYTFYNILKKNINKECIDLYNFLENSKFNNDFSYDDYRSLNFGIYIALFFCYVPEIYYYKKDVDGSESIFGHDDYALLLYCKENDKFTFLLPCEYTRGIMRKIFESLYLNDNDNVIILEKKSENIDSFVFKLPLWKEDNFSNHFHNLTKFRIYNYFFYDENMEKEVVRKIIEKITIYENNGSLFVNTKKYVSSLYINPSSEIYCKYIGTYVGKYNGMNA